MPDEQQNIYWNSSVFLEYIDRNSPNLPVLDTLVDSASHGEILIVTSMLSITEVAIGPRTRSGRSIAPGVEAKIENLWIDDSIVRLIDFHELIAREARNLIRYAREQEWSLQAADAIHLASAQRAHVVEIHTYDTKWPKFAEYIGCPIVEPYVRQPRLL